MSLCWSVSIQTAESYLRRREICVNINRRWALNHSDLAKLAASNLASSLWCPVICQVYLAQIWHLEELTLVNSSCLWRWCGRLRYTNCKTGTGQKLKLHWGVAGHIYTSHLYTWATIEISFYYSTKTRSFCTNTAALNTYWQRSSSVPQQWLFFILGHSIHSLY